MKTNLKLAAVTAVLPLLALSCAKDGYDGLYAYESVGESHSEPASGDKFEGIAENPFVKTTDESTSTFSIDADGASYAIMRRYLNDGLTPNPESVRIEEFLNYFTFDYPDPTGDETVAINAETGACPWNKEHRLLRLGLKGKSLADNELPAANYVFLIDVSGSMCSTDKLPLLKSSLTTLLDYLQADDYVSIVTYSGTVQKLLEATKVHDKAKIKAAIAKLDATGSTAGGKAIEMAYEEALGTYIKGGNNRVIMGTDGDFNVGVTSTDALVELVEGYAEKGVYLTVCGFGSGNLNDAMIKKICIAGNGTYQYIDSEEEMAKVFVQEASKFVSVANDTKVQVKFNPKTIDSYRLIGYERRVMKNSDFEDDTKDAGEIGAGQTITALYELIPAESYKDGADCGSFECRYKLSLDDAKSRSLSTGITASEGEMSESLSFAAGVASYGMVLLGSEYKGSSSFDLASSLVKSSLSFDPHNYRAGLLDLIDKAKELSETK